MRIDREMDYPHLGITDTSRTARMSSFKSPRTLSHHGPANVQAHTLHERNLTRSDDWGPRPHLDEPLHAGRLRHTGNEVLLNQTVQIALRFIITSHPDAD